MSTWTMQQILVRITNVVDGREAFLLFAIPDPDGVPGHPLQAHCAIINAFAAEPSIIAKIPLGNTLVIEGPGDFDKLAVDRLSEMLGEQWVVEMFSQQDKP